MVVVVVVVVVVPTTPILVLVQVPVVVASIVNQRIILIDPYTRTKLKSATTVR
jgi:hypothetical protein